MTAHLGPGLQGIKETGWEKVLFAPATANFPAPRDPPNDGSPHPTAAVPGGLGSPDQQVPGGRSHPLPAPSQGSASGDHPHPLCPLSSTPQHGPGTRGRAEQSSGGAAGEKERVSPG